MGDGAVHDAMLRDGLLSPWSGKHMAQEATEVAAELEITRADMDRWAVRSHARALAAIDDGRMAEEIVAVTVATRKSESLVHDDEAPRRETTLEALARLPALFVEEGTHTAGNSPGVNDGAAAIVVSSESWAREQGREPLAEIVAHAEIADEFPYLARVPALAARAALERAGLEASQVDLWEINEAFASVTLQSIRMLGIDEDRVNVNGGAVALGHPIGASGARILATLVHELRRRGGGVGCAAICSGGAQGDAIIVRA
jgi:acetyl-CoA C-acetyltransferase